MRKVLSEDEQEREQGDPRRHHQTAEERAQWPDLVDARMGLRGMADGHLELLGDLIAELGEDYRKALSRRQINRAIP
jgi:hypothetical protein